MLAAYPAFLDYLLSVYTGTLQQPTRTLENTRETRHVGSNGGQDSDPNYERRGKGDTVTRNFDTLPLLLCPPPFLNRV